MTSPIIIACAITGSVPRKKDNPAVPTQPAEQIESTHEAFEAGASLAHIHVRDDDENPSSDQARFALVMEGIRKHCPGMIVQLSTGGRGRDPKARGDCLSLAPDMASLATGSCNFPSIIYENPVELIYELAEKMNEYDIRPEIEAFDLSMLYKAHEMAEEGVLKRPLYIQYVMAIKNAMPARREAMEFMIKETKELEPDANWVAAGIGRWQRVVNDWSAELGGHIRTGLEDNVRYDKNRLAASNAELVTLAAEIAARHGRRPATPAEAREILHLRPA
jgi:3-keto-5-aminohexanoate cleavage enzyme